MIINSYLRRSWRCNASAGKHLFHSVHHWTKEGNLDCNLKNYFSPSLQPVVWGVVNDLCRRVDILSRARSRLPPAEKHLRARRLHLGLTPPPAALPTSYLPCYMYLCNYICILRAVLEIRQMICTISGLAPQQTLDRIIIQRVQTNEALAWLCQCPNPDGPYTKHYQQHGCSSE